MVHPADLRPRVLSAVPECGPPAVWPSLYNEQLDEHALLDECPLVGEPLARDFSVASDISVQGVHVRVDDHEVHVTMGTPVGQPQQLLGPTSEHPDVKPSLDLLNWARSPEHPPLTLGEVDHPLGPVPVGLDQHGGVLVAKEIGHVLQPHATIDEERCRRMAQLVGVIASISASPQSRSISRRRLEGSRGRPISFANTSP